MKVRLLFVIALVVYNPPPLTAVLLAIKECFNSNDVSAQILPPLSVALLPMKLQYSNIIPDGLLKTISAPPLFAVLLINSTFLKVIF